MTKKVKRSVKSGLPPGSLIHVGEHITGEVTISLSQFNRFEVSIEKLQKLSDTMFNKDDRIYWLNIDGLGDTNLIRIIGETLNLHVLTLEDILNTEQRPKIEDFGDYFFLVLKMLSFDNERKEIKQEQLSIILKDNIVLTFQEREGDVFQPLRDRLKLSESRARRSGSDYLVYALMDAIVDNYFLILEKVSDEIEIIEELILNDPSSDLINKLYRLKRNVLLLRKTIWPLREVVSFWGRSESKMIRNETQVFFRDLYDHTIQVIDNIESLRDLITGMVDIYLTTISNKMNSVMKVLTIIATIFIPLTFIAGVYGMNFVNMPELEWKYGYFGVMTVMFAICMLMLYLFKRKKWL